MKGTRTIVEEDSWGRILAKINAKPSQWILLDSKLEKAKRAFITGKGIEWSEVKELRKTWRSDFPFIDSDGNPFVLYIYDQSGSTYRSRWGYNRGYYNHGPREYKFHFCWCPTLEKMTAIGRRARYKAKNDIENNLFVANRGSGRDEKIKMNVCKFCLMTMNYKNYNGNYYPEKEVIHDEFDMILFFEEHAPQHLLRPSHPFHAGRYTSDWPQVRRKIIEMREGKCEKCGATNNLHVHHKNGIKDDNGPANLQVLCKTHHAEQPMHEHMRF